MVINLSVWSEMQICIWPSWCHCHSLSVAPVNPYCFTRMVLLFWFWLTQVFLEKRQLNECSSSSSNSSSMFKCESDSILYTACNFSCHMVIWPIEYRYCWWPHVTLKVIHLSPSTCKSTRVHSGPTPSTILRANVSMTVSSEAEKADQLHMPS